MPVVSVRFDESVHQRLKRASGRNRVAISALAEQLVDEGLRMRDHPRITFRDGPAGRRAGLVAGPDVVEVVSAIVGGDVPPADRVARAADLLGLSPDDVEAAVDYYADFTEEVDRDRQERRTFAEETEQRWRRRQELVAR
jgi:hypothetical protein